MDNLAFEVKGNHGKRLIKNAIIMMVITLAKNRENHVMKGGLGV